MSANAEFTVVGRHPKGWSLFAWRGRAADGGSAVAMGRAAFARIEPVTAFAVTGDEMSFALADGGYPSPGEGQWTLEGNVLKRRGLRGRHAEIIADAEAGAAAIGALLEIDFWNRGIGGITSIFARVRKGTGIAPELNCKAEAYHTPSAGSFAQKLEIAPRTLSILMALALAKATAVRKGQDGDLEDQRLIAPRTSATLAAARSIQIGAERAGHVGAALAALKRLGIPATEQDFEP